MPQHALLLVPVVNSISGPKGGNEGEGKEDPHQHPWNSAASILSPMCMAFALGPNGEGTPISVVENHLGVLFRILYCITINT